MTAMPPTNGHAALIDFAFEFCSVVTVVLSTQPDEPFLKERESAIVEYCDYRYGDDFVEVVCHNEFVQQNPKDENDTAFWEMWADKLRGFGFKDGDYIIASEEYGIKLAESVNGVFIPFDPSRTVNSSMATAVRLTAYEFWDDVLAEFQELVRPTVTIFGAESTGKSTLTKDLAEPNRQFDSVLTLPEWARTYLEMVGPELTVDKMTNIWKGQKALQMSAGCSATDKRAIVQDTDLFSTLGYWLNWDKKSTPNYLTLDAVSLKSDLYIITPSNIPFEQDPLRYGGDKRELDDKYWIDMCEAFGLNYVVLKGVERFDRKIEAREILEKLFFEKVEKPLQYERQR